MAKRTFKLIENGNVIHTEKTARKDYKYAIVYDVDRAGLTAQCEYWITEYSKPCPAKFNKEWWDGQVASYQAEIEKIKTQTIFIFGYTNSEKQPDKTYTNYKNGRLVKVEITK